MSWDVVVVGAGVNGLTAAARLAVAGRRVLVVEQAETVGGSARTAELLDDGVRHDLGAAVVPFAAASPAFAELGLKVRYRHSPVALAHPLEDGRAGVMYQDLDRTANGLGGDGRAYRRMVEPFVARFDQFTREVMKPQVAVPRHPILLARFGAQALLPATWRGRGLATEARALWIGLAAHSPVPPDRALTTGVGLTLAVAGHAVGWPVVEGGTQGVADALAALIVTQGGEIELGRRVGRLDELAGARATMLDVTPRQFVELSGGSAGDAYRRWKYGPGVCKVDYVLSGAMPWTNEACRQSATVHVGGTAAEILAGEREVAAGRVAERPFVLVAQPHVADPTREVNGRSPLWTYCRVPHGSDYDASAQIERQLDRFAPDWRDLIVAKRVLTAKASEATNPNLIGGDLAAGRMTPRQLLFGPRMARSPYRTNLSGVFLCSSSCPPGPGIHGMPGWHAAGEVLKGNR